MYDIFEELLEKFNVTAYRVAKDTGISTATLTQWKKGIANPKNEKLQKIADYFHVSLDYLITGKDPAKIETPMVDFESLGVSEDDFYYLLGRYKGLSQKSRERILKMIDIMDED